MTNVKPAITLNQIALFVLENTEWPLIVFAKMELIS